MGEWVTKTLWSLLWLPLKISGGWIRVCVCVCVCVSMSLFKYNCISCLRVLNHVLKLTTEFDWKLSTWREKLNLHSFRYLHTLHGFLPLWLKNWSCTGFDSENLNKFYANLKDIHNFSQSWFQNGNRNIFGVWLSTSFELNYKSYLLKWRPQSLLVI